MSNSFSLQDVVPWSLIYGELNSIHQDKLKDLGYSVIIDYIHDRIAHGWKEDDPKRYFTESLKHCLKQKLITENDVMRAKSYARARGLNMDTANYYFDILITTLRE
jgi:hypothetical protein